jgi:hypothetical protein
MNPWAEGRGSVAVSVELADCTGQIRFPEGFGEPFDVWRDHFGVGVTPDTINTRVLGQSCRIIIASSAPGLPGIR